MYGNNFLDDPFAMAGILSGLYTMLLIWVVIAYVVGAILMMRIFSKAGREPWKAWIPFLNTWNLFEICYLPGWLILLSFIPLINIVYVVAVFIMNYRLPQCFEKSAGWGILCIFFPLIVQIILAIDHSEYCGYEK